MFASILPRCLERYMRLIFRESGPAFSPLSIDLVQLLHNPNEIIHHRLEEIDAAFDRTEVVGLVTQPLHEWLDLLAENYLHLKEPLAAVLQPVCHLSDLELDHRETRVGVVVPMDEVISVCSSTRDFSFPVLPGVGLPEKVRLSDRLHIFLDLHRSVQGIARSLSGFSGLWSWL